MGEVCNGCQPTFFKVLAKATSGDSFTIILEVVMPKTNMWP